MFGSDNCFTNTSAASSQSITIDSLLATEREFKKARDASDAKFRDDLKDARCDICGKPIEYTDHRTLKMCGHVFRELRRRFLAEPQVADQCGLAGFGPDRLYGVDIELHKEGIVPQ